MATATTAVVAVLTNNLVSPIYTWGSYAKNYGTEWPIPVSIPPQYTHKDIASVTCNSQNGAAIINGTLYMWPSVYIQQNVGSQVAITESFSAPHAGDYFIQLQAGRNHLVVLSAQGTVYTYSSKNDNGELGSGDTAVRSGFYEISFGAENRVINMYAPPNGFRTIVLTVTGQFYGWGNGLIGDGSVLGQLSPALIKLQLTEAEARTAQLSGGPSTFFVHTNNQLYSWGHSLYGEFDGAMATRIIPEKMELPMELPVESLKQFTCAAACFALLKDNTLYSWANPEKGMLGWGSSFYNDPSTFLFTIDITKFGKFQYITMQRDTGMILANGLLYGFGSNSHGQIGDNSISDRVTPVLVQPKFFGHKRIIKVQTGYHTLAITEDNVLYAWVSSYRSFFISNT